MLKIKSNTNKFTIIFQRRLERKRMLKRSRSASVLSFSFSATPSCFSVSALFVLFSPSAFFFFFSFQFQRLPFLLQRTCPLCLALTFFLFFLTCCPIFFSPKHFFSPSTFSALFFLFSLGCPLFFSPKYFFFQPKRFCFSSATLLFFFFLLYSFLVQPKNLSLFVVQRLLLFVYFLPAFLFCLQPLRIALFQPKCSAQNLFQLLHVSLFE